MSDRSTDSWRFETLENPGVYMLEANAGTGKTHALTSLCVHLLETGKLSVEQVLMVTFTRAAAAELQQRIEQRIRERLQELVLEGQADAQGGRLLQKALEHLDEASICTIDSFYHRIFGEYAYELGMSLKISAAGGARDNLERACQLWWRRNGRTPNMSILCGSALGRTKVRTPEALAQFLELWRRNCGGYLKFKPLDPEFAALPMGWDFGVLQLLDPVLEGLEFSPHEGTYRNWALQVLLLLEECDDTDLSPRKMKRCKEEVLRLLAEPSVAQTQQALIEVDAAVRDLERAQLAQGAQPNFSDFSTLLFEKLSKPSSRSLRQRLRRRWRAVLVDESQDNSHLQFDVFKLLFGSGEERKDEGRKDENLLLFIGDPKQAIFSWRGGDLHSWMETREESTTDYRVSPPDNWRSRPLQVAAVNEIFSKNPHGFEGGDVQVGYRLSRTAEQTDPLSLQVDGNGLDGLHIKIVDTSLKSSFAPTKLSQRQTIANHCATKIATLLQQAQEGRALLVNSSQSRPLAARDIVVLTRTNGEASLMRKALNAVNLASVMREARPVLDTPESFWLLTLMRSLAAPQNYRLLRAALATPLLHHLHEIEDDNALRHWSETFHNSHVIWKRQGFYPAMMGLLAHTQVAQRLVLQRAGQRSLTNLFHLLELLAQKEDRQSPPSALVYHLETMMQEQKQNEEHEIRLETDEDTVQIATVHKAKGLEFPVVFLPFVWGDNLRTGRSRQPPQIVRDERGRPCMDLAPQDDSERPTSSSQYEDIRLLYVALTRAISHTHVVLPSQGDSLTDTGILGNILFKDPYQLQSWKDLAAQKDNGISLEIASALPARGIGDKTAAPLRSGRAETFTDTVTQSWQISSYSSIVAREGGHPATERSEQPDHDQSSASEAAGDLATLAEANVPDTQVLAQAPPPKDSIFTFPKGAETGLFFHHMLEWMVLQNNWGDEPEALTSACYNALKNSRLPEQLAPLACTALQQVARAHLPEADHCLKEVSDSQQAGAASLLCSELEFEFPLAPGWQNALAVAGFVPAADDERLKPRFMQGFMKGFIDLTWVHEGRYWLADLKSNWLGPTPASYGQAQLRRAADEHAYRLQLSLYSLALHRHLQTHLADYDYERHFGGSFLLFLRAMEAGRDSGIWHHRLPLAELQKLDSGIGGSSVDGS